MSRSLRGVSVRALMPCSTVSTGVALAAAVALSVPASGAPAALDTGSLRVPISDAAAVLVGGTTFPSLDVTQMSQLWKPWAQFLGQDLAAVELVNAAYPAELSPFSGNTPLGVSVAAGVESLYRVLTATYVAGTKLMVWGISQGAMVLEATQRFLAAQDSAPPPGALTFVRLADPGTALTGILNFLPSRIFSNLLRCTTALCAPKVESQYDTIVVVNQYDGFADFPNDPWNLLAIANALVGLSYRHSQTAFVDLNSVPEQYISTTVNSLGATTTTYRVPSLFLPLTQPLRDMGVPSAVVDRIDSVLKPIIDSGYAPNPVAPPAPVKTAHPAPAAGGAPPLRDVSRSSRSAYPPPGPATFTVPSEQQSPAAVSVAGKKPRVTARQDADADVDRTSRHAR